MENCNIKYDSNSYSRLEDFVRDCQFLIGLDSLEGAKNSISMLFLSGFGNLNQGNQKVTLSNAGDKSSIAFISDLNRAICNVYESSETNLPKEALDLKRVLLESLFEVNSIKQYLTPKEERTINDSDQSVEIRTLKTLELAADEIYGPINGSLLRELLTDFGKQLKRRLVYNDLENIKYELNSYEVNARITRYKAERFNNILDFLKSLSLYKDDKILLETTEMYPNGFLNGRLYYYVLDLFKKHLASLDNVNLELNSELSDKIKQKHKTVQTKTYEEMVKAALAQTKIPSTGGTSFAGWFNNKYKTHYHNSKAQHLLFQVNRFSNYYEAIKKEILKRIDLGTLENPEYFKLKIHEIENPENSLLSYVNDYMILTLFDDLVKYKLGDNIVKNKNFIHNSETAKATALKYDIAKSHKHQRSGWETENDEGSETHTSSNLKDILENLLVYDHLSDKLLPHNITLTTLIQSWQALMSDILNPNTRFNTAQGEQIKKNLLNLIYNLDDNVFDRIRETLKILFDVDAVGGISKAAIQYFEGTAELNKPHKNILYSFYKQVLDTNNPYSIYTAELNRINGRGLSYSKNFTDISASLAALLYRNVENKFIDCNNMFLGLSVKSKFNWDSTLFDMVERVNYETVLNSQNNVKIISSRLKDYKFLDEVNNSTYTTTIKLQGKDKVDTKIIQVDGLDVESTETTSLYYTLGFKYVQGKGNIDGLFNFSRIELISDPITIFKSNAKGEVIEKKVNLFERLNNIDIEQFKKSYLLAEESGDFSSLTEEEILFKNLLKFIDSYLKLDLLTETGLDTLELYKLNYTVDYKSGAYSKYYLEHFLKLAMRAADLEHLLELSEDRPFEDYLLTDSKYVTLIKEELKRGAEDSRNRSTIINTTSGNLVLFPLSTKDALLSNWAQYSLIISGRSMKSTNLNKSGATVANYSVARLGSEIFRRLAKQRELEGACRSLLFVLNPTLLETVPVLDSEITTLSGLVKLVKDMTSGELFQHALLDKFYISFIKRDLICFQPTVYSDKTTFLNYLSSLGNIFGEDPLNLMNDYSSLYEQLYKNTFFAVHDKILDSVLNKIETLINSEAADKVDANLSKFDKVKAFLRSVTLDELMAYVQSYNAKHTDKIELESESDFRVRKKVLRYVETTQQLKMDELGNPLVDTEGNPIMEEIQTTKFRETTFCDLNEITEFYASLSYDDIKLRKYLKAQELIYIDDLKTNNISYLLFNTNLLKRAWIDGRLPKSKLNYLLKILSSEKLLSKKERAKYVENWVDESTGELLIEKNGELNPFFKKFFYIEGLMSNNLRLSLSGSEVNHPDKAKYIEFNKFMKILNKAKTAEDLEGLIPITELMAVKDFLVDHNIMKDIFPAEGEEVELDDNVILDTLDTMWSEVKDILNINDLRKFKGTLLNFTDFYNENIIGIINTAEGTQFKRNVIIPATLLHPITGLINGVANQVRVAVIEDMQAPVNNLRKSDTIDALDGSAKMSSILVILENNSLGDQKVGTNRKPIWDDQTSNLTSFLAKFAAFGLTNALMLLSVKSDASEYNLFKKMHNIRWNKTIDITKNINQPLNIIYNSKNVNFWFKTAILNNQHLYYKNKYGDIVEIEGFGREKGIYYTLEKVAGGTTEKVFHYFDNNSNHYTELPKDADAAQFHTIDSLFELFVSMGGINCVDSAGRVSEFSNQVLANFVINVGHKKNILKTVTDPETGLNTVSRAKRTIDSVEDVVLPLKDKFIGYVFNQTAVKNGAKNVNRASLWTNDEALNTFSLNIRGLGIQLNADHDVNNSTLTEFSQVIAACAAYGRKFTNIHEIYYSLGKSAEEASRVELDSILEYYQNSKSDLSKAKYKLYLIIGKLIVSAHSNSDLDLTERLKTELQDLLNISKDNMNDSLKIPFSDPSIYTQFITNITSVINAKSIKRQHPGAPYVMVPGYNVVQYFQMYDPKSHKYRKYMFDDILNRARVEFKQDLLNQLTAWCEANKVPTTNDLGLDINILNLASLIEFSKDKDINLDYLTNNFQDTTLYNKQLVEIYLNRKQAKEAYRDRSWFMPTDKVLIEYPLQEGETVARTEVRDLSDMKDYYAFTDEAFVPGTKFKMNITSALNLKPSLIRWLYAKQFNADFTPEAVSKKYKVNIDPASTYQSFVYENVMLDAISISLLEDPTKQFILVKEKDADGVETGKWQIHFKTHKVDENGKRIPDPDFIKDESKKARLFKAAMEILPLNSTLTLVPNAEGDLEKGIGLTPGSISGFKHLLGKSGRAQLVKTDTVINTNFVLKGSKEPIQLLELKKVGNVTMEYLNIYDLPIIKNQWKGEKVSHQEILKVLDDLEDGTFEYNGQTYQVAKGTLENTEAELVMGNMYLDQFNTKNSSIADILDIGEDFFKTSEYPKIPQGFYNLAFVKANGRHTLITTEPVHDDSTVYSVEFDKNKLDLRPIKDPTTDDILSYDVYSSKTKGVLVGRYIKTDWELRKDGKVYASNTSQNPIDPSRYFISKDKDGNTEAIYEKIDLLKKYRFSRMEEVNGESQMTTYVLYLLAKVKDFLKAYSEQLTVDEAYLKMSELLKDLYDLDKYLDILINNTSRLNDTSTPEASKLSAYNRINLSKLLQSFGALIDPETNLPIPTENVYNSFTKHIVKILEALVQPSFSDAYIDIRKSYYDFLGHYKKLYVSFLDSLHFISSRIPAQSLQSFMPMICIGWTGDTSNTAYVSYILTYLLGSDYDIDKAYIMGQSYDDGNTYIGWSSLFDYRSEETLAASKFLPVPRKTKLTVSEDELYLIEDELNAILTTEGAEKILNYAKLIKKLDDNKGYYNFNTDSNLERKKKIISKIKEHEKYEVPYRYRESAYKNVASANIKNVVHAIRNRDLAYSPITIKDLSAEAESSPKGTKTRRLNMINPLTKYIMLNLNLVGKNVIGIAANGEKDWFNLTYYYHNILRTGNEKDLFYLSMNHTFNRIKGRAKNIKNVTETTVKHIPDLWNVDQALTVKLKELFYSNLDPEDTSTKEVDQLISLLLSAATDNAKELILAKINAGTNLARYHLHLMMMGFSLDDIVAFMTCPVVELIDRYSNSDVYNNKEGSIKKAIAILEGRFNFSSLIKESLDTSLLSEEEYLEYYQEELLDRLAYESEYGAISNEDVVIKTIGDIYNEVNARSLDLFFQKYVNAKTNILTDKSPEEMKLLSKYELPKTDNMNINYIFKLVNLIINDINNAIEDFNKAHPKMEAKYDINDFTADLQEFKILTEQSQETSDLAATWLKLNQGIPQTDLDLIKLLKRMNSTVSTREYAMGILKLSDSLSRKNLVLADEDYVSEDASLAESKQELIDLLQVIKTSSTSILNLPQKKSYKDINNIITNISLNNKSLKISDIAQILLDAVQTDLFGNFDIYKFLEDKPVKLTGETFMYNTRIGDSVSYRELAATYFNLLKSSWNILDIVNRIPQYKANIDLLNYSVLQRDMFSTKAKIIDRLLTLNDIKYTSLTDQDYNNLIKYADKIISTSYFLSLDTPINLNKIINNTNEKSIMVFNPLYDLIPSSTLSLNSLNGIDSLKYLFEGPIYQWLKTTYPDNDFVTSLTPSSFHGKSLIKTKLDLSQIENSFANKLAYNKMLIGFKQLESEAFDDNYSVADIVMLYNLAVNGTKLGGKYLTSLFVNSVHNKTINSNSILKGTVMYDYYSWIGDQDYTGNKSKVLPTKRDFLMAIAPTVYSKAALPYRKEPYVRVADTNMGYSYYRREKYNANTGTAIYSETKEVLLNLDNLHLSEEQLAKRINNYVNKSLMMFPELHKRLSENTVFLGLKDAQNRILAKSDLVLYIRLNKLLIYKIC